MCERNLTLPCDIGFLHDAFDVAPVCGSARRKERLVCVVGLFLAFPYIEDQVQAVDKRVRNGDDPENGTLGVSLAVVQAFFDGTYGYGRV